MITADGWCSGYLRLAGAFPFLGDKGREAVYREFLVPLMDDAVWRRTVMATIQTDLQTPTIARLIENAEGQWCREQLANGRGLQEYIHESPVSVSRERLESKRASVSALPAGEQP
jgi:hypothetical protein